MIIDEYECYMYKKKEEKGIFEYQSELDTIFWNLHEIDMHGKNIYMFSKIYIYIYFIKNRIFMKYLIIIIILLESFKFMIYIKVASIINKYNLVYEKK